jgi:hypothetical protein
MLVIFRATFWIQQQFMLQKRRSNHCSRNAAEMRDFDYVCLCEIWVEL